MDLKRNQVTNIKEVTIPLMSIVLLCRSLIHVAELTTAIGAYIKCSSKGF